MKATGEPEMFHVVFDGGATCTARISDPPQRGQMGKVIFEWSGHLTQALFPRYRAWVHSINEHLAGKWQVTILHVFVLDGRQYEAWAYAPGQPVERVE